MKPTIELFLAQHARALRCAQDIAEINEQIDSETNFSKTRILLGELAGVLKPHLMSEDRLLYPTLMRSADFAVAATGQKFWNEMSGISEAVYTFLERWRKANAIESDPRSFASECSNVFAALKKRIDAEERELYPLIDANS